MARYALEVAEELRVALDEHVPEGERPLLIATEWATTRPPNDYADLFDVAARELRRIRGVHPGSEIVVVVSGGTAEMQGALLLAGSVGVVDGPVRLVQVERNEGARRRPGRPVFDVGLKVPSVLQVARELTATHAMSPAPSDGYELAKSPRLVEALRRAHAVAQVPFPVLLRGERGVGKSRLATFIRLWSPYRNPKRADQWPAVACGQFSDPQLMLSELCGSVKGAYTGAVDRRGLFALADGDTFFMDEIHDLTDAAQRALMRVLDDGTYYRLGSAKVERSRFRLISGTNLASDALRARLFADFYDRIRDVEVEVPPLRECREDLGWMWRSAWAATAHRARLAFTLSEEEHEAVLRVLAVAELPGNWRDLRRVAVRLMIETDDTRKSRSRLVSVVKEALASDGASAEPELPLLSKKDLGYLARLEGALGKGLELFWAAVAQDRVAPIVVLERLLGDGSRARRASRFIEQAQSARWARTFGTKLAPSRRR